MQTEDAQLLLRTSRGDEAAARALWDRHGGPLIAYVRAVLGPRLRHEAEDVVQNVMCSILKTPAARLREVRDARLWLATSARRAALNTLRAAGRERRRREQMQTTDTIGQTLPATGQVNEVSLPGNLWAAIDRLPRRLREVVLLKHIAALSFDQMSLSLARHRSTLSTQYQSALALLRDSCRQS